jgi:uncharacterized protein with von Willebrand factor type A (vWA) domain
MKKKPLVLIAAAGIAGCSHPGPPMHLVCGIDTSGSAQADLGAYAKVVCDAAACTLAPGRDSLTIFRFDTDVAEIYGPNVPESPDQFQEKIVNLLKEKRQGRGTHPAAFFSAAAEAAESSDNIVTVVCLTDGGIDGQTEAGADEMAHAAHSLASNPKVIAVVVAGTKPGTRERYRQLLAPLSGKLTFKELEEVN